MNISKQAKANYEQLVREEEFKASQRLQHALQNFEFKELYEKKASLESALAKGENVEMELKEVDQRIEPILAKCKPQKPKTTYSDILNGLLKSKSGFCGEFASFERSNASLLTDENKQIYGLMQQWCEKKSDKNVVLSGNTGVGKTHLMQCMADSIILQKRTVYYSLSHNMLDLLANEYTKYGAITDISGSPFIAADVLFIDDLGTEPVMKNLPIYLQLILEERAQRGKPTVVTTNLLPPDIRERYGDRVLSRLFSKTAVSIRMTGKDLRMKIK